MKSHAVSAGLHLCFLVLAFLAPAALVVHAQPDWVLAQRTVRWDDRVVDVRPPPLQPKRTIDDLVLTTGDGTREGDGRGDAGGDKVRLKATSTPASAPRKIAATNAPTGFVADVDALLDGFADETLGPDTLTALGALDEGEGGRGRAFGVSGEGVGRAASCFGSWDVYAKGKSHFVKSDDCKGRGIGRGSGTRGFASIAADPDLGDRGDVKLPTVVVGQPVGCPTVALCPWKEIIRKVVQRHERELRYCYETALNRNQRGFGARVEVSFALPPEGGPADIDLASDSGVDSFDECVSKRVASWIFPRTGEQIRANYPFQFATL